MRKFELYESEDGCFFDVKEKCVAWEYKTRHLPDSIVFYDENMEELTGSGIEAIYDRAEYMEIIGMPDYKRDEIFLNLLYGFDIVGLEPGLYDYDSARAEWCLLEKEGE